MQILVVEIKEKKCVILIMIFLLDFNVPLFSSDPNNGLLIVHSNLPMITDIHNLLQLTKLY